MDAYAQHWYNKSGRKLEDDNWPNIAEAWTRMDQEGQEGFRIAAAYQRMILNGCISTPTINIEPNISPKFVGSERAVTNGSVPRGKSKKSKAASSGTKKRGGPTGFSLFSKNARVALYEEWHAVNPGKKTPKVTDFSTQVGAMWKALPDEEKAMWVQKALAIGRANAVAAVEIEIKEEADVAVLQQQQVTKKKEKKSKATAPAPTPSKQNSIAEEPTEKKRKASAPEPSKKQKVVKKIAAPKSESSFSSSGDESGF